MVSPKFCSFVKGCCSAKLSKKCRPCFFLIYPPPLCRVGDRGMWGSQTKAGFPAKTTHTALAKFASDGDTRTRRRHPHDPGASVTLPDLLFRGARNTFYVTRGTSLKDDEDEFTWFLSTETTHPSVTSLRVFGAPDSSAKCTSAAQQYK